MPENNGFSTTNVDDSTININTEGKIQTIKTLKEFVNIKDTAQIDGFTLTFNKAIDRGLKILIQFTSGSGINKFTLTKNVTGLTRGFIFINGYSNVLGSTYPYVNSSNQIEFTSAIYTGYCTLEFMVLESFVIGDTLILDEVEKASGSVSIKNIIIQSLSSEDTTEEFITIS